MTKKQTKTKLTEFAKYGMSFRVLVPCRDDETGKAFKVGDLVSVENFDTAVLENWLDIGVIEPREVE